MSRKTRFISVEVLIKTDHAYDAFVQWFTDQGEPVTVVPDDKYRFQIYFAPLPGRSPDETIRRLCRQIADLSGPPRQQWETAGFREFYIGYELGEEPLCYDEHLSCETVSAAVSVGAGIGWALYAIGDDQED
jgi:uncharacterized protein (DUF2236 family)